MRSISNALREAGGETSHLVWIKYLNQDSVGKNQKVKDPDPTQIYINSFKPTIPAAKDQKAQIAKITKPGQISEVISNIFELDKFDIVSLCKFCQLSYELAIKDFKFVNYTQIESIAFKTLIAIIINLKNQVDLICETGSSPKFPDELAPVINAPLKIILLSKDSIVFQDLVAILPDYLYLYAPHEKIVQQPVDSILYIALKDLLGIISDNFLRFTETEELVAINFGIDFFQNYITSEMHFDLFSILKLFAHNLIHNMSSLPSKLNNKLFFLCCGIVSAPKIVNENDVILYVLQVIANLTIQDPRLASTSTGAFSCFVFNLANARPDCFDSHFQNQPPLTLDFNQLTGFKSLKIDTLPPDLSLPVNAGKMFSERMSMVPNFLKCILDMLPMNKVSSTLLMAMLINRVYNQDGWENFVKLVTSAECDQITRDTTLYNICTIDDKHLNVVLQSISNNFMNFPLLIREICLSDKYITFIQSSIPNMMRSMIKSQQNVEGLLEWISFIYDKDITSCLSGSIMMLIIDCIFSGHTKFVELLSLNQSTIPNFSLIISAIQLVITKRASVQTSDEPIIVLLNSLILNIDIYSEEQASRIIGSLFSNMCTLPGITMNPETLITVIRVIQVFILKFNVVREEMNNENSRSVQSLRESLQKFTPDKQILKLLKKTIVDEKQQVISPTILFMVYNWLKNTTLEMKFLKWSIKLCALSRELSTMYFNKKIPHDIIKKIYVKDEISSIAVLLLTTIFRYIASEEVFDLVVTTMQENYEDLQTTEILFEKVKQSILISSEDNSVKESINSVFQSPNGMNIFLKTFSILTNQPKAEPKQVYRYFDVLLDTARLISNEKSATECRFFEKLGVAFTKISLLSFTEQNINNMLIFYKELQSVQCRKEMLEHIFLNMPLVERFDEKLNKFYFEKILPNIEFSSNPIDLEFFFNYIMDINNNKVEKIRKQQWDWLSTIKLSCKDTIALAVVFLTQKHVSIRQWSYDILMKTLKEDDANIKAVLDSLGYAPFANLMSQRELIERKRGIAILSLISIYGTRQETDRPNIEGAFLYLSDNVLLEETEIIYEEIFDEERKIKSSDMLALFMASFSQIKDKRNYDKAFSEISNGCSQELVYFFKAYNWVSFMRKFVKNDRDLTTLASTFVIYVVQYNTNQYLYGAFIALSDLKVPSILESFISKTIAGFLQDGRMSTVLVCATLALQLVIYKPEDGSLQNLIENPAPSTSIARPLFEVLQKLALANCSTSIALCSNHFVNVLQAAFFVAWRFSMMYEGGGLVERCLVSIPRPALKNAIEEFTCFGPIPAKATQYQKPSNPARPTSLQIKVSNLTGAMPTMPVLPKSITTGESTESLQQKIKMFAQHIDKYSQPALKLPEFNPDEVIPPSVQNLEIDTDSDESDSTNEDDEGFSLDAISESRPVRIVTKPVNTPTISQTVPENKPIAQPQTLTRRGSMLSLRSAFSGSSTPTPPPKAYGKFEKISADNDDAILGRPVECDGAQKFFTRALQDKPTVVADFQTIYSNYGKHSTMKTPHRLDEPGKDVIDKYNEDMTTRQNVREEHSKMFIINH